MHVGKPIPRRWPQEWPPAGGVLVPPAGATKNKQPLVRERPDRVLPCRLWFARCHAPGVAPPLANAATPVRGPPCGGALPLAPPRSTPPASPPRGPASAQETPRGPPASARAEAGGCGLSPAPSPTACPGQPTWATCAHRRGQPVISPPWGAVALWSPRQGAAAACRMGALLHTFVAGVRGR